MQTGRLPYTGILQKKPSSFRLQRKPLIILILQAEGCFRYLSAKLHFIWRRTENRSPEIEKSFGWELFTAFRNERKLKDAWNILHSVIYYITICYRITWRMKALFCKTLGSVGNRICGCRSTYTKIGGKACLPFLLSYSLFNWFSN